MPIFPQGAEGLVALTINGALCRGGETESLAVPLRELLHRSGHKATLFLTLEHSQGQWRERDIKSFVRDGHELGGN